MSSEPQISWLRAPIGQREQIEGLWRSAREGRMSHAFGFFGPRGVGKFLSARWFTAGLLCSDPNSPRPGPPCGTCGPCKRVEADSHPDVYLLDPVALGIDPIRIRDVVKRDDSERKTVDEFLMLKAAECGYRVVVLRDFERANASAQNSLLKTLEEPGDDVVIILESSAPARLVGTVKSRIVTVVFDRLSVESTRQALGELGFDSALSDKFSRWCHGAPGRAAEMNALGAEFMLGLIERALGGEDALALVQELSTVEAEFLGKTPSIKNRARARFFLDLVLEVCVDLQRAGGGLDPRKLAYGDLCGVIQSPAAGRGALRSSGLRRAVDLCLNARQDVDMNLTPDAACERALIALGLVREAKFEQEPA